MKRKTAYTLTSIFLFTTFFSFEERICLNFASSTTTLFLDPQTVTTSIGKYFTVNVEISAVVDLYGWEFKLSWNNTLLEALNVTEGNFLNKQGKSFFVSKISNIYGQMLVDCTLMGDVPGVSGDGLLATANFIVKDFGESLLDLYDTNLVNSLEQAITHTTTDGTVRVTKNPIARFMYSPKKPFVNETVVFNATSSSPNGGTIVKYEWKFGDGNATQLTNPIISHSYAAIGDYNVTLNITDSEGLSNTTWALVTVSVPTHDIAIINVTSPKTVASEIVYIYVDVENQGAFTETFNVTAYANSTSIATFTNIALYSRSILTVVFQWNATSTTKGNYIIGANVTSVPGESELKNNVYTNGMLKVTRLGDINGDNMVDILDIAMVARAYGSYPGHSRWNANADLDNNNIIDILDIAKVARNYGK